jgi:CheY-like chemotaxis protein
VLAVEFAYDGLQAIDLARKLRPASVITEILVPKPDGLKVGPTLKATRRRDTLPS